ncbi:ATP-binding protein [Pseudoroseicyclus sp. CXY001]|uniref:sensor histidine kinase n=1 Tax=Pseudoroseicyclus sp. CXY001 TaxID=3242492 RepID=UPI0035715A51
MTAAAAPAALHRAPGGAAAEAPSAAPGPGDLAGLRLLVIDPDEGDRQRLCKQLTVCGLGQSVAAAPTVAAAAGVAADCDLAFVDYRAEGKLGQAAMVALTRQYPRLGIIMTSALTSDHLAGLAIRLGALTYLPKSEMSPRALRRALEMAATMIEMRARLLRKQQEMELFAHALAHDLKSPAKLASFLAHSIAGDLAAGHTEDLAADAAALGSLGDRMVSLIDTLALHLSLDRPVPVAPVPLDEALDWALANLTLDIGTAGARILRPEALPVVSGDLPQIGQLFQNLLSNALRYAGPNVPRITISAEPQAEGWWQVAVSDRGLGIAGKDCARIFNSFTRLHSPDQVQGTGLGLSICKKIVEQRGGRIWCESALGEGATFRFTLPAAGAQSSPASAPASPAASRPGPRDAA